MHITAYATIDHTHTPAHTSLQTFVCRHCIAGVIGIAPAASDIGMRLCSRTGPIILYGTGQQISTNTGRDHFMTTECLHHKYCYNLYLIWLIQH